MRTSTRQRILSTFFIAMIIIGFSCEKPDELTPFDTTPVYEQDLNVSMIDEKSILHHPNVDIFGEDFPMNPPLPNDGFLGLSHIESKGIH